MPYIKTLRARCASVIAVEVAEERPFLREQSVAAFPKELGQIRP
jgi:hypothetical protein